MISCTYELDSDMRLHNFGADWDGFARRNGAPELASPGPVGHRLNDLVTDNSTQQLYDRLFAAARRSARRVSVPFRCDAPDLRRFLELHIDSIAGGGFHVRSELLREEVRGQVPLLDTAHPRDARMLSMCSFCKQVRAPAGWMEAEPAVRAMGLFEQASLPAISHGVCPRCLDAAMATIESVGDAPMGAGARPSHA